MKPKYSYPEAVIIEDEGQVKRETVKIHERDIVRLKGVVRVSSLPSMLRVIENRETGNLVNKALALHPAFDWVIVRDNYGRPCLLALRK